MAKIPDDLIEVCPDGQTVWAFSPMYQAFFRFKDGKVCGRIDAEFVPDPYVIQQARERRGVPKDTARAATPTHKLYDFYRDYLQSTNNVVQSA